jgi:hypothetical protein
MTAAEVKSLAFTRNISEEHIKATDITLARARYVTAYITGTIDETGTFYTDYVKPVIAFGVAVDIFDRLASNITDRGIVMAQTQGMAIMDREGKAMLKDEYRRTLNSLIRLMLDNLATGLTETEDDIQFDRVTFYGTAKIGSL